MSDYNVSVTLNPKDDAAKITKAVFEVSVDNCPNEATAAAIAGTHVKRYFGERKVGISLVEVKVKGA